MGSSIQVCLLIIFSQMLSITAETDSYDLATLYAIQSSWQNTPPSWKGSDPCSNWDGIACTNSRVISIKLSGMLVSSNQFDDIVLFPNLQILALSNNKGLKGTLPPSIGNLKNLNILKLDACSFFGPIPDSIGSLQQLVFLALNSNSFSGPIPASIGYLLNITFLDVSENQLSGTIPVSNGTTPGLDMLVKAQHFHFQNNQLSGTIQPQLFSSNMNLIHFVFNNNQLRGNIPPTLGLVQKLKVVRLDSNSLSGSIPPNLNNLTSVSELYLSNNELTGPLPNLTSMNLLTYVDMSNNSFDVSEIPLWFTEIQSLTTLVMENTQLEGHIPVNLFSLPQLETVVLSNNKLNGTLDIGTSYSNNLTVDLQNNSITDFTQKTSYNMDLALVGNPICQGNGAAEQYCTIHKSNFSYLTPINNCTTTVCRSASILSPNCKCACPYTGTLQFFSISFSNLKNSSYFNTLAESLMSAFRSNHLPVDSVSLSDPNVNLNSYLLIRLQIFPSGLDHFNRIGISTVGFLLSNHPFQIPIYGSYSFKDDGYRCFAGAKKSSNTGIMVGAIVGSFVLVILILGAGFYAFHQKRKAKRAVQQSNLFENWDRDESSGGVPQLKGARWFSFEELRKCTNNFAEVNAIGSGGYGKVYRGTIASGQLVAIKRAQQGSLQGALEFKTEIELLSRIHHKNVVSLVGFCYEQGEQMLVYEYIPNGTLKDGLSGKSGFQLNWMRRLRIALDSAKGLAYMHELANPPIIHRDIKSTNILLDDRLNAKVTDFGLSKLMEDTRKSYVSTQVKGTMGYMDPEYYTTQQLSEKSDVYSFGIVLLELVTAKAPIEGGKYIVVVVKDAIANSTDQYYIQDILDPTLGSSEKLGGLKNFVELAMRCIKDYSSERPTMGEVVREIENIMQLASSNKNFETEFTSSSYEGISDGSKAFDYSGGFLPLDLEGH